MKILGIETSCDETAISIVEIENENEKPKVLSNIVSSQIELHSQYGGVVPNLAAREHVKNIDVVFKTALKEASLSLDDIDLIAVTQGPGLIPALMIGTAFAQSLSYFSGKPVIGVNHMAGHIYSNWVDNKIQFPILNLIVSGGHTMLVIMKNHGEYELVGETVDDAVGEAFDKVARILGLGYPGGPKVSAEADKYEGGLEIDLPRPMLNSGDYNFSFSGLKTAVLYKVNKLKEEHSMEEIIPAVSHEFQKAAVEVLITKTKKAAKEFGIDNILLSGGVAANKLLRETLQKECEKNKLTCHIPNLKYTTDNAAMIAIAGYFDIKNKKPDWKSVRPNANLKLSG